MVGAMAAFQVKSFGSDSLEKTSTIGFAPAAASL